MTAQQRTYEPKMGFFVAVLAYTLLVRLLPYASTDPTRDLWIWNYSPIYAVCLFGAAFYRDRSWAFAVPLATYLVGDFGIWALTGRADWAFYPGQPYVYASVALFVVAGLILRRHRSWLAIGGAGLLGATLFYLVSNFGVWAAGDGVRYPHTIAGLSACYVAAIPFFGRTLVSTALFTGILFSRLGVNALEAAEQESSSPGLEPARERVAVR